jgi:hypothetical protein
VWSRKNDVPDRTAYRCAAEPKVRAKIKAYRRRAVDRAFGRLAGMVQIVCFGRNMLWRHMKVAFRGTKGNTGTLATLNCILLLNHAGKVGYDTKLLCSGWNWRHRNAFYEAAVVNWTDERKG